jgi:hypothetical protein
MSKKWSITVTLGKKEVQSDQNGQKVVENGKNGQKVVKNG